MSDGDDGRSGRGVWTRVRQMIDGRKVTRLLKGVDSSEDVIRPSRALGRVLELMAPVPFPVLVDLGPVTGSNVSFLGERLACRLHLEDLFSDVDRLVRPGAAQDVRAMLANALSYEADSVDAVLAWDLFDYLAPEEASTLVGRIARVLRPGGLVMALFTTVVFDRAVYRKYIIEDAEHLRHRWLPYGRPPQRALLGGEVERLFAPLEVTESYLLTHHQRETLLRRPGGARKAM
jgi:SAM-dependent methyltransferase